MIKSVEIINSYGEKIKMVLDDPELNGYAITNISGIEPVQVDIKQTQLVSGLKYKYNFGFYKSREITFSIVYLEWLRDEDAGYIVNRKIEEARDNLYKYFKTNDKIQMIFERGRRDGLSGTQLFHIEGYVNKHQPTFFSQSCGATISVTCPNPWFKECWWTDQTETELSFTTVVQSSSPSLIINYKGDIFTGFKLTMDNELSEYAGETISLNSTHNSVERKLLMNIPERYNTFSFLNIDLISDILSVYTSEPSEWDGEYYAATLKETTLDEVDILEEGEVVNIYGSSDDMKIGIDNKNTIIHTNITNVDNINEFLSIPLLVRKTDVTHSNPRVTDEVINNKPYYLNSFRLSIDGEEGTDYLINTSGIEIVKKIYFTHADSTDNIQFPILYGQKVTKFEDIKNRNGWIDATSISKRQEIPALYPGQNVVELESDIEGTTFKIEYNTLYRGL